MTLSSRLKEISDRLDAADSGAFDGDDLRRLISAVKILTEGLEFYSSGDHFSICRGQDNPLKAGYDPEDIVDILDEGERAEEALAAAAKVLESDNG